MDVSDDTYLSIAGTAKGIYREKASKFIAIAIPASTEKEALAALETVRREYHDANHHCYAYRVGITQPAYRFNDDGEPSGSAGRPIYGQILSAGFTDLIVVVVRYFGGTKLGVPGLIHAYKTASREALDQAVSVEKTRTERFMVTFDYPLMNEVMRLLKEEGARILSQNATTRCSIEFTVRKSRAEMTAKRFSGLKNISLTII